MGIRSKWRAGHMKDPVSGVFRVTDWYDAHPHSSPSGTTLTGVIVADGIAPTPAEAKADHQGKWSGHNELPITVDRADPSNFRIEWDQVVVNDWQATARQRANEAASRLAAGQSGSGQTGQPGSGAGQVGADQSGFGQVTAGGAGAGDLNSLVQQALRSAGMDPGILNSGNRTVHVETTFGTATPGQAGEMMAGFFGGGGGPGGQFGSFGQAGQVGSFGQAGQAGQGGAAGQFAAAQGMTVPATGVVRAVHDVVPGMPLPEGMSQADLTLDVMRSDGSTYAATTRLGFRSPARRAAIATVGTQLPVLVDPNDPGRLTVDLAKIDLP
jgi:hypothetical protein